VTPPAPESLRQSPEIATLLALASQLDLVPAVLASIYGKDDRCASADHARGLVRMARILNQQVGTYLELLEVPAAVTKEEIILSKTPPAAGRAVGAAGARKR